MLAHNALQHMCTIKHKEDPDEGLVSIDDDLIKAVLDEIEEEPESFHVNYLDENGIEPGDVIECVEAGSSLFTVGSEYVVENVPSRRGMYVTNDHGWPSYQSNLSMFRLKERYEDWGTFPDDDEEEEPEIVVEGGPIYHESFLIKKGSIPVGCLNTGQEETPLEDRNDEGINPKDLQGEKKPPMRFIPPAALLAMGNVMALGGKKYGPMNWREKSVRSTVYYDAAMRHLFEWLDGQTYDAESGEHQLAHVMACCGIILDAEQTGNLKDDRPNASQQATGFIYDHLSKNAA